MLYQDTPTLKPLDAGTAVHGVKVLVVDIDTVEGVLLGELRDLACELGSIGAGGSRFVCR